MTLPTAFLLTLLAFLLTLMAFLLTLMAFLMSLRAFLLILTTNGSSTDFTDFHGIHANLTELMSFLLTLPICLFYWLYQLNVFSTDLTDLMAFLLT
jgi:hypothetical protein